MTLTTTEIPTPATFETTAPNTATASVTPLGATALTLDGRDVLGSPVEAPQVLDPFFEAQRAEREAISQEVGAQVMAQMVEGIAPSYLTIGKGNNAVHVDVAAIRQLTPGSRGAEALRALRIPAHLVSQILGTSPRPTKS